ncbi:glycoside hydrolase family 25 protein [Bifidobacterium leontopitheci]|uniref:1,4-beta-N-acetylmuramidase n=1 Tax=Bifidobacterium leontopitheci TaxID=2650774 RepID=A0A6I1GL68_9BIFI|nr:glycoside hydrolase family 25 protein [Bifidobacterium leontopitheci]KAB7790346.1 1,4-beta-N-acetylmuramidase [Bifidobacterium leontopitheci]
MGAGKRVVSAAAIAAAAVLLGSVGIAPASALSDVVLDSATSSATSSWNQTIADESDGNATMPDNPAVDLPQTVNETIPDDATVVAENLAVTPEGELKNLETGQAVTDPELVGTADTQPDPLAKTNGQSFIPVEVGEVRQAVTQEQTANVQPQNSAAGEADAADGSAASGTASVAPAAFGTSQYGAYWGTYNGSKAFFDNTKKLFVQQAKGVVDVSEWQEDIDWAKAKADGVEGAIIRLGFGSGNRIDEEALYNIKECKRLGIPFGVYWYSYADTTKFAAEEGTDVVAKLKQAGVKPGDLSYPVYYDLEQWTWTGHTPPTTPAAYEPIVNAWYKKLQAAGYTNLAIYSYTAFLNSQLNSTALRSKASWVAQYAGQNRFTGYATNFRGWQYTSRGQINGIQGYVDMNAFGVAKADAVFPKGAGYFGMNSLKGGAADFSFGYGKASDQVLVGDWNGDGKDTLTLRRQNLYYVKNSLSGGAADVTLAYGKPDDVVLVGDWNGDGKDTLAVRRGNIYYFKNSITGGAADRVIAYGRPDDIVLVGDWNGDGKDTLAVRRGNMYYVKNSITSGIADKVVGYGKPDDSVLVGDWNGDRRDTFAVRRSNTYYIKNTISDGAADMTFSYGKPNDTVLVGDWDGDGNDTFMVRR